MLSLCVDVFPTLRGAILNGSKPESSPSQNDCQSLLISNVTPLISRTWCSRSTILTCVVNMLLVSEQGTLAKVILMGREDLLMMQLFGGGAVGGGGGWLQSGGWLHVVFLAFLLAVPIFRPERIRVVASYRRAFVCFALSIIAPSAVSILMMSLVSPGGGPGGGLSGIPTFQLFSAAGPVLFGISLIFAMKAIVPGFIPPQNSGRPTGLDEQRSNADSSSFTGIAESMSP